MTSIEGKSGLIDAGTLVINNNVEILKPVDIINEFEDTEVEQKFQVLGNQQPEFLNSIVNTLLETKNFALVEGLEKFKWIFHFDYYGYDDDGKTYQIFHSIHHESTPKFWIRKKLSITQPSEGKSVLPLVRKEKKEEINRSYSGEYIDSVVEQYKKLLGKDVYLLGRLTRRKYYSFLRNERSLRTYNIGVDFCEFMDKQMSQLEIEYKWRGKEAVEGYSNLSHLLTEFDQLGNILLFSPIGSLLNRTTLTKFEWMTSIKKGD